MAIGSLKSQYLSYGRLHQFALDQSGLRSVIWLDIIGLDDTQVPVPCHHLLLRAGVLNLLRFSLRRHCEDGQIPPSSNL